MEDDALNSTNSRAIEKRLEEINETLSSISAKEVLFIIALSFLTCFVGVSVCLQLLERRKRKKQSAVPQAIVIQPNNVKSDKSGRNDKSKVSSSGYEKDVLPSKSMKMKVAITPNMSTVKKTRAASKENIPDESQKSDVSKTESSKIDVSQADRNAVSLKKLDTDMNDGQLPLAPVSLLGVAAALHALTSSSNESTATAPSAAHSSASATSSTSSAGMSTPAVTAPVVVVPLPLPPLNAAASNSSDSMTSFTVPEEGVTHRTKSPASVPKSAVPSTPTATTLSGLSATPAPSDNSAGSKSPMATAKEITPANSSKSPVSPLRSLQPPPAAPPLNALPPPNPLPPLNPLPPPLNAAPPSTGALPPINTSTPPPMSEKKELSSNAFPNESIPFSFFVHFFFEAGFSIPNGGHPLLLLLDDGAPNLVRLHRDTDCAQIGGGPSGYGPPATRMTSSINHDDRLRNRYEACRSGMQELDVLRAKHTLLIQNLRSRLPVIPGSLEDVQTREKKSREGFLDRFSLQSVDSGISSQNTISSTRSSTPEDFPHKSNRHSNIYENNSTTMNYSTFRKLSLESTHSASHVMNVSSSNNNNNDPPEKSAFAPPVITSRSCHRGVWKTSPQRVRPKSMFDSSTSTTEYLYGKPPRHPIDLSKERRSAFMVINPSTKRHSSIEPSLPSSMSQLNLNEDYKKPQKAEVIRRNKEKADAMFRANVVYVSSVSEQTSSRPVRFSPARSPPVRRAVPIELKPSQHYAQPCKIRSPKLNSKTVFAAKPIAVRPTASPKVAQRSTWLQSQPL